MACVTLCACHGKAPAVQHPADVIARAGAPVNHAAPGRYASAWVIPEKQSPPPTADVPPATDQSQVEHDKTLQFIHTSPVFQARIDGKSFDAAIASMNAITAQLPPEVGKGFQQAARLLMIANLPIEKARAQKRDVSESEIHEAVLQAIGNKTPWEILVAGQAQLHTYQQQAATQEQATPLAAGPR
ncbi:MAG: hypothetical protein ACYC9P_06750 [Rudaea sp.]